MYNIEQLQAIGGKLWESGEMRRVYFNDLAPLVGLKITKNNSGNIRRAELNGEDISNSEAKLILEGMGKVWFDLESGDFNHKTFVTKAGYAKYGQEAIEAIKSKLGA